MSDALDLVITLTPPPQGAPPDEIARIGLSCPALGSAREGDALRDRWHIDQQHGRLIAAIAAAAQGHEQARSAVEEMLPELEAKGWHIADATRRIWAGEREWDALIEELDAQDALLVLRVLEEIASPSSPQPPSPSAGEGGWGDAMGSAATFP
ncbi:MAG TPA: hypothetical protein VFO07_14495, partial [Roseiflexaceae bacterium]|nr:hypothetical protein [Roseiflexaceae bacterium]